ncbi:MAG: hypothetical protein ABMA15_22815 [Vicinamibacterales bacterium]
MAWIEATALATWVRQSPSLWAYPTVLTLHTLGLGIVVGASTIVDLRLLGYARRIRLASLVPLFPLMAAAFALNAATGIMLFMADATTKSKQPVFYVKLLLIFAALWCTLQLRRVVGTNNGRDDDTVPARAHRLAWITLLLWVGAITAGRLMAYL